MKYLILILILLLADAASAQVAPSSYQMFNTPMSGTSNAFGRNVVAAMQPSMSLVKDNPALLDTVHDGVMALGYQNYVSDISFGSAGFAKSFDKAGVFSTNLYFAGYGDFVRTDNIGNVQGEFSASDYLLSIGYSNNYKNLIRYGVNVNQLLSQYDTYTSYAVSVDIGMHYVIKEGTSTTGLTIKNLGMPIVNYVDGQFESLPLEVQAGLSYRLGKSPITFTILGQHLNVFQLGDGTIESPYTSALDNSMRHLVPGVTFTPFKALGMSLSYNYHKREQMKLPNGIAGLAGFSGGVFLKLKKFKLSYSYSSFHLSGSSNYFTFTKDINN